MWTDKYQHFRSCFSHTIAPGKSKDFKGLIHDVRSLARPFINPESATSLGTVKSTWLWEKRRREHSGTAVDGFATHSGIEHIPLGLEKGGSHAGFPFYFLSVVKCTSFHQPGHTTKRVSLSSFLLELTSWQHCSQPDRQSWCQTYVIFTVSLGSIPAPESNYTLQWACWPCHKERFCYSNQDDTMRRILVTKHRLSDITPNTTANWQITFHAPGRKHQVAYSLIVSQK